MEPGAVVLMSTDGLHGVLSEASIEEALRPLRAGESLEECGKRLIGEAKTAGGPDNVTVVLMRRTA
jgi:serine/threonine protein phosphatase PrpC